MQALVGKADPALVGKADPALEVSVNDSTERSWRAEFSVRGLEEYFGSAFHFVGADTGLRTGIPLANALVGSPFFAHVGVTVGEGHQPQPQPQPQQQQQ